MTTTEATTAGTLTKNPPPRCRVLGIPCDTGSSHLRGAAYAPAEVRRALQDTAGNSYSESGVDTSASEAIVDLGDLALPGSTAHEHHHAIVDGLTPLIDPRSPLILLGGDHAISWPSVQAHATRLGSFDLLQFDAHPDLYPSFGSHPYSHASPFARICERKLCRRLVQVGLRSTAPAQQELATRYGVEQIRAAALTRHLVLPDLQGPVYLSIDLDVLDPAFAPGVSHPEPGGLSTRDLLCLLSQITVPIAGVDIVELNPYRDVNQATARVAAKLVREIVAQLVEQAGSSDRGD